jgi:hypothetical protein
MFKEWDVSGGAGAKQPGETINITGNVTLTAVWLTLGEIAAGKNNSQDLMIKFGIKLEGYTSATTADVNNTFIAVKAYINNSGVSASDTTTANAKMGVIALGDYVDLPSLSVAAYGDGGGAFTNANERVQVVGVNSYTKNGNSGKHLVFQFKDIMVSRRMNATDTNAGGYAASEMRKYLTTVSGDNNSGKFLAGLLAAGVPQSALWAPNRVIGGASSITVTDSVYLPTVWEVAETNNSTGSNSVAITANEGTGNQGRLTIYGAGSGGNNSRVKDSTLYWLASASTKYGRSSSFCVVDYYGVASDNNASFASGIAPAFCVK